MPTWIIILIVIAIVLILLGVFVEVAQFLLWIGLVVLVIAVIWWLIKFIGNRAR